MMKRDEKNGYKTEILTKNKRGINKIKMEA